MILSRDTNYTIETAIRAAAEAFESHGLYFGHGTDSAIDEASWLILHSLGLSPVRAPDFSRSMSTADCERCNSLLLRRINERIPAAYILGEAWFAGHRFLADERALVPRSPLAEFIQNDFFGLLEGQMAPRILDLCTGGGCIAIACAQTSENSIVDASDLSSEALDLAASNVALHGLEKRVFLLQGSLFEPVNNKYSLIVSNPPYVDALDLGSMPREFRHEPAMGLAAGEDGLDLVRIMLKEAVNYLQPHGYLVVEVGNSGEALEECYPEVPFAWLEFARGGHGVFVLSHQELLEAVWE